jgi:hypothetical protein
MLAVLRLEKCFPHRRIQARLSVRILTNQFQKTTSTSVSRSPEIPKIAIEFFPQFAGAT